MKEPKMTPLTKSLINGLNPEKIIYAEFTPPGSMGNEGGVIIYIIKDKALICYETNFFTDEENYNQAVDLLLNHENQLTVHDGNKGSILFDYYYGGVGNNVFIKKNANLEIKEDFFLYRERENEYKIISSVSGVFESVVNAKNREKIN